jgi:hypothetical protein
MTRGEVGKSLNTVLETIDALQDRFKGRAKVNARLDTIRDHVVLLALDLGLPVQPIKEEKKPDVEPGNAEGSPTG